MGRIEHSLMVRDIPLTDLRPPPATTSYHKKVTTIPFRREKVAGSSPLVEGFWVGVHLATSDACHAERTSPSKSVPP